MTAEKKFNHGENIILKGPVEAREIRMSQPNESLSSTDLAGKYFDLAKECERHGKYKAATEFRRDACNARDGFRAHLDYR